MSPECKRMVGKTQCQKRQSAHIDKFQDSWGLEQQARLREKCY